MVEKKTGLFIGFVGLHHISGMPEVNLGYLLARSSWGNGHGIEACHPVMKFGTETARLSPIVGVTHPDNTHKGHTELLLRKTIGPWSGFKPKKRGR